MLDNLFDKMTQMTPKDLEVFDFEPIKEFIKELSEKQMEEEGLKKLFELIKRFPLEVYDNSYHEFINKVNS